MQILQAFISDRYLSARQLCFHKLAQARILTVAQECPIRGVMEKRYGLQGHHTGLLPIPD
ncbi:MAG TPA: hypothetical protein IGS53_15295 [Leptolyngbyaceae cyanobacterium M33_DOE_097]|uniref:Uncharacterized protein n=1 Tax=Oscillatoriales cyanobacterium SpSt-418 TaxID=2282169 RepID=A0A7C3PCU2_9CYAN|nr:hypothetical protein [Leptolyngbyaceae cyanobacterium M33_DOE_097]